MDTVSKEKRSETMRAVKSKNSNMELFVRRELYKRGYRYRANVSKLFGKPDIVFRKRKLVIFLDSCFWHGCRYHCRMPASNRTYWKAKIERNRKRDKEVFGYYKKDGWKVLRFWEHKIKKSPEKVMEKILQELKN